MKKLLCLGGLTGLYGYRLANKKDKEIVVFDIDSNILKSEYGSWNYYKSLSVLSKLTDMVVFTNGNNYYHGHELDNLYNDTDGLDEKDLCEDKFMLTTCGNLVGAKIVETNGAFDPFKMMNKTHFVTMRNDNINHTQMLVKMCCMVVVAGILDDLSNIDPYHL